MSSALMAFVHHLAAFTLAGSIIFESVTFRKDLTLAEARRIQRVDIAYGLSAALVAIAGLLRVFYFEKGAPFYVQNWFFWTKMAGFTLTALLSIYPTIKFLSWNRFLLQGQAPDIPDQEVARIGLLLRLEILGIVIILLSAALMARGLGMM